MAVTLLRGAGGALARFITPTHPFSTPTLNSHLTPTPPQLGPKARPADARGSGVQRGGHPTSARHWGQNLKKSAPSGKAHSGQPEELAMKATALLKCTGLSYCCIRTPPNWSSDRLVLEFMSISSGRALHLVTFMVLGTEWSDSFHYVSLFCLALCSASPEFLVKRIPPAHL